MFNLRIASVTGAARKVSRGGNAIRRAALVAVVIGPLALGGIGLATQAEARVKDTDTGSLADLCRSYQQAWDFAMDTYDRAVRNGDTAGAHAAAVRAVELQNSWNLRCKDTYGSIVVRSAPVQGAADVGALSVQQSVEPTDTAGNPDISIHNAGSTRVSGLGR